MENHNNNNNVPEKPTKLSRRRQIVRSFAAKMNQQRTFPERIADFLTRHFGTLSFAIFHLAWFAVWIVWNLGMVSGLKPFDPFPFGLLTMVVSLEAIFLAIFVLVSQNREAKIDRLRSEVEFQVDLISEQEITKVLNLLKALMEKNGIDLSGDAELERMLKQIDAWDIERRLEKDIAEKS